MMHIYNIDSQDAANAEQTIRNVYDVSGKGISVLVEDSGNIPESHQEFKDSTGTYTRVTNILPLVQSPYEDHVTHVAGTIGARGVNPKAKGFAPDCSLVTLHMDNAGSLTNSSNNYKAHVNTYKINISNHSYGKGVYYSYTTLVDDDGNTLGVTYILNFTHFIQRNIANSKVNEFVLLGKYDENSHNIDKTLYDVSDCLSVWAAGNNRADNYKFGTIVFKGHTYSHPIGIQSSITEAEHLYDANNDSFGRFFFYYPKGQTTNKYYLPFSSSNSVSDQYDSLPPTALAKNSLVVGSIGREDMNNLMSDPKTFSPLTNLSLFSSSGPTDDGRIKPELVADGSGVFSTISGDSINAYDTYSGTSMAAPAVAGSAVLVHEYYRKTIGNQSYRMPSATLKAILLANAYRGNAPPNYATGYGIVDVSKSLGFLQKWNNNNFSNTNHVYLSESLHTGGTNELAIYPKATDISVNILICWNDYHHNTNTIYHNTNNTLLDASHSVITNKLVIECQDSVTQTKYYPWYLNVNNPAATARNAVTTGEKDSVWDISAAYDNTKLIEFTPKNTNMHIVSVKIYEAVKPSVSVGQKYTLLVENAMSGQTINLNVDYVGTNSPFYKFYHNSTEVTEFIRGNTYVFTMRTVNSSHPFFVGADGHNSLSPNVTNVTSGKSSTNGLNVINETLTLAIPTDYTGVFSYFCTSHSAMYKVMTLISPSASALGDPYIYPYFGTKSGLPIKLPDLDAYYTMYQSTDVSIYAHVKQATCEHKQRMIEYVEMLKATNCVSPDILVTSVETDGFFFKEVYVVVKGEPLYIDLDEERGRREKEDMRSGEKTEKGEKIYRTGQFCEPCQYMQIPLNECLFLNIMFFENPHIENGLELVGDVPANATGILVREEDIQSRCNLVSDGPWQYHHPCLV